MNDGEETDLIELMIDIDIDALESKFSLTIHDYEMTGEQLLKARPKPYSSLASVLKDIFLERTPIYRCKILPRQVMHLLIEHGSEGESGPRLSLWSCINDEERFWFAMCILKYNSILTFAPIDFRKVYEDLIAEDAGKFWALEEASKLLLSLENEDRSSSSLWLSELEPPEGYKIKRTNYVMVLPK